MIISTKTQISIALLYFLIAAAFGVFLRSLHVFDFEVNYRFIVHGHSHIALLGWVYLCITIVLYNYFSHKSEHSKKNYQRIFIFTQCTLLGMMITFPFQGYALFSIIFSTLFLFASYVFTWFFFKNVSASVKQLMCYPYIKAALYYLVLSSIGPWALGAIMTTLGSGSDWYRLAIYFYLHFQYNGWMLLAIIGLLLFIVERRGITLSRKHNNQFFTVVNISVLLTFFLSALWTKPSSVIFGLSLVGASLQLICFAYAINWVRNKWTVLQAYFSSVEKLMLKSIALILGIKLILQFLGSIPYFANLGATIIEFTIGYLHWIFLGVISLSLFFILNVLEFIKVSSKTIIFYLIGFILTEGLIIYKGIVIWSGKYVLLSYYNELLLIASMLLFLGIAFVFLINKTKKTYLSYSSSALQEDTKYLS
jgi:hypothetical protein